MLRTDDMVCEAGSNGIPQCTTSVQWVSGIVVIVLSKEISDRRTDGREG